jgi:hypothetical protein
VPLPPESKPKDAIREDFREKKEPSDFTNNPFNERYEAAQSAVDENPYQTPKSDYPELKPQDEVKDPQRSGLKWILFSFEGRIPRSTYWAASIGLTVVLWGLAFVLIIICGGLMSAFAPGNRDQFSEDAFFSCFSCSVHHSLSLPYGVNMPFKPSVGTIATNRAGGVRYN